MTKRNDIDYEVVFSLAVCHLKEVKEFLLNVRFL